MNKKVLAAIAAGGLLVGAGIVTSIVSAPATASAQEESAEPTEDRPLPRALGFLEEVLDDLVDQGTIDDDQADAILDATEERATELREEWEERHPNMRSFRRGFRFGSLLDDGGIDSDEYAELGENHPLKQLDVSEYLEDGLITSDELREIHKELKEARSDEDA
jgi:hypothetical protein